MTVGQSIKSYRLKNGLTQNELAEKLNVSYQTISKWETDTNEPDIKTLNMLCKIFNCTLNELVNNEEDKVEDKINSTNTQNADVTLVEPTPVSKVKIGICKTCENPIYENDKFHHMSENKRVGRGHHIKVEYDLCDSCYQKLEESKKREKEIKKAAERVKQKKLTIWSYIIGAIVAIITLVVCILNYSTVGIGWTICLPVIILYVAIADVYCISLAFIDESWIGEMFFDIAGFSIKMPGVIFTFDADGLAFLIGMKIFFAILSVFISVGVFLFALLIASICSIFCFPYMFIKHKNIK